MYNNTTNLTKKTNNTSDSSGINDKLAFQILNYIYIFVFSIGCIGNTLIITYFINVNRKKLKKMSAYHFLLILLAIVDLIVCITAILDKVVASLQIKMLDYQIILGWTAIYILVIISYLRYKAITSPLKRRWSKKCYFLLCLICFCCCTCLWIIYLRYDKKAHYINFLAFDIAPLTILCFFLFKMTNDLKKRTAIANDQTRKRNKIALNTVKYLITIYFLTVVLVQIVEIIMVDHFETFRKNAILNIFTAALSQFYLINNMINVFVYARFMKGFRHFLWNIKTCKRMKIFTKKQH